MLADVFETTDAFIQVADLDYRWLGVNKASAAEFERIFGSRPKVGDSMLDLLAEAMDNVTKLIKGEVRREARSRKG